MPREMSSAEVDDFLTRNPDAAGRVVAFGNLRDSMGWDQIAEAYMTIFSLWTLSFTPIQLPIPAGGLAVSDSKYGNVIIFPDAVGDLHYTCDVSSDVAAQINLPPYASPSGNTLQQILDDLKNAALKLGGAVAVGLIGFLVLEHLLDKRGS